MAIVAYMDLMVLIDAMVIMAALAIIDVIAIGAVTSIICFLWYNWSVAFITLMDGMI